MRLRHILAGAMLAGTALAATMAIGSENVKAPAWLEPKIAGIAKEKREFLLSDKAERIAGTYDKLFQRLRDKTPQEIEAYIDGMMSVVEAGKFHPETDMASIPLDTSQPTFNSWKLMRPSVVGAEARSRPDRSQLLYERPAAASPPSPTRRSRSIRRISLPAR